MGGGWSKPARQQRPSLHSGLRPGREEEDAYSYADPPPRRARYGYGYGYEEEESRGRDQQPWPRSRHREDDSWEWLPRGYRAVGRYASRPRDNDDPRRRGWFSTSSDDHDGEGPGGTLVRDNVIVGDPRGVRIGLGNRGGRRTGGRVTGNLVVR